MGEREEDEEGSGEPQEDDSAKAGGPDEPADEDDGGEARITPVREKIGEGRDNLRRRGGWFRRRTDGSEK